MWCWRRMEKISWTDYVRNEVLLMSLYKIKNKNHTIVLKYKQANKSPLFSKLHSSQSKAQKFR